MKIIVPDYYPKFACRMGACRHSCCIGWEIDIDDNSLERFRSVGGEIGAKLKNNIIESDGCASFRLGNDERCPFLNGEGLCELILTLGKDCLCQICADHPRFRNFFSDREEIGLGLCCEAAADLILKNAAKTQFILWEDDGCDEEEDPFDQDLLNLRAEMITAIQDRSMPFLKRLQSLPGIAGIDIPEICIGDWAELFLSLERLDETWTRELNLLSLPCHDLPDDPCWEIAFEQLAVYLLHRHLPGALYDDDLSGRTAFAMLVALLLYALCAVHCAQDASFGMDDFSELARMYSSEIEYSDENIEAVLNELHRRIPDL